MTLGLIAVLLACTALHGETAEGSLWKPLQFLLGNWRTMGLPADVTGKISFQLDLGGHVVVRRSYLQMVNGPRHEQLTLIYRDGPALRATHFDSAGQVTPYKVSLPTQNRVVFEKEGDPEARWSYQSDGTNLKGSIGDLEWTAVPDMMGEEAAPAQHRLEAGWKPIEFLVGDWMGTGSGAPGAGSGKFSFRLEVGGQVLVRRSLNALEKGPRHEDLMLIYAGGPGGAMRAMYFDSEGHVIRYGVGTAERERAVFESSDGPSYRLSYWMADGELKGKFEVAGKTYLEWSARKERQ